MECFTLVEISVGLHFNLNYDKLVQNKKENMIGLKKQNKWQNTEWANHWDFYTENCDVDKTTWQPSGPARATCHAQQATL